VYEEHSTSYPPLLYISRGRSTTDKEPKEGKSRRKRESLCGKLHISTKRTVEMWKELWIVPGFYRENKGKETYLWIRWWSREKEFAFRNLGRNSEEAQRSKDLAGVMQRKKDSFVGDNYFAEKKVGFVGEARKNLRKIFSCLPGGENEEDPGMFRAHESS
jgi:hypothetical protein